MMDQKLNSDLTEWYPSKTNKANVTQSKLTGVLNAKHRRQPAVCSALISCLLEFTSVLNHHI